MPIFSLQKNTSAEKDSILARDLEELLDTTKQTEIWKNVRDAQISTQNAAENVGSRKGSTVL